ncbi:DUF4157 domain-containing protein [Undibacterium sp. Ji83W]|uniref:eCIS core domain-containing protein n=1 Tax=Undibacterium sp. Ji83W TaxID=3413043 RepID=UPI003BF0CB24
MPITLPVVQRQAASTNDTGLPNHLKTGIESLSGMSMDNVKVHYNSRKPAQLNALAYAQGRDIHLSPGQEQHLPHEAWHVVQQAQGRVKPTMQMKAGVAVNDSAALENEADVMGRKASSLPRYVKHDGRQDRLGEPTFASADMATQRQANGFIASTKINSCSRGVVQRVVDLAAHADASANNQYFIKTNQRQVLYSLRTVAGPRPSALYHKENERSATGIDLYKWTPNVRLFGNAERADIESIGVNTSNLMRNMDDGIKNPQMTADTVSLPSQGVLGKNDCRGLGGVLNAMISQEGMDNTALLGNTMEVGDQMTHNFPLHADCQYHSATVVAKDLPSLVTLEADVSKDRSRPEFYIRGGVAGFVAANNLGEHGEDNNYGNNVTVNRASGRVASDLGMATIRGIHSYYATYSDGYHLPDTQGVTDTPALAVAKATSLNKIRQIATKYWGKYTSWKFTPTGVSAIRDIVGSQNTAPDEISNALALVKAQASMDLVRQSEKRKPLTTAFYTTLSGMNIQNIDSLNTVIFDIDALIARMDAGQN